LGLRNLVSSYKGFTKIGYDVYGFVKMLIYGRILQPASKMATVRQNEGYYEAIIKEYNADNVYDTLGFIAAHKEQIIRRMNTALVKKGKRRTEIIYYDVTNFYFEIGGGRRRDRRGGKCNGERAAKIRSKQGREKTADSANGAVHGRGRSPDSVRIIYW